MKNYIKDPAKKALIGLALLFLASESISYSNIKGVEKPEPVSISETVLSVSENPVSEGYAAAAPKDLYARYAALIDADNNRVLYEKKGNEAAAMASTTKIMTLIVALEYGDPEQIATVSKYAAAMPDVQLNVNSGDQYLLKDLFYSLMLKSHNDTAVVIAENVALNFLQDTTTNLADIPTEKSKELVAVFAGLMNEKARALGCESTYFITPNGLDASDENGVHSSTAIDLCTIMAYCIKNQDFLDITQTPSHTFSNKVLHSDNTYVNGSRSFTITNSNTFLNMMDGVISGKTGFTNDAGYCYVCAVKRDDKTFISVVLGSGWPNNKSYKWTDTRKLMTFGINNYLRTNIFSPIENYHDLPVHKGILPSVPTRIEGDVSLLLSKFDKVNIVYAIPQVLQAPIRDKEEVGTVNIYVNDELYEQFPILAKASVGKFGYFYCLGQVLKGFMP